MNLPLALGAGYCIWGAGSWECEWKWTKSCGSQPTINMSYPCAYPWATGAEKTGERAEKPKRMRRFGFIASFRSAICFDFSSLITFLCVALPLPMPFLWPFLLLFIVFGISNCCQFPADMTFLASMSGWHCSPRGSPLLAGFLDFDIWCHGSEESIFRSSTRELRNCFFYKNSWWQKLVEPRANLNYFRSLRTKTKEPASIVEKSEIQGVLNGSPMQYLVVPTILKILLHRLACCAYFKA